MNKFPISNLQSQISNRRGNALLIAILIMAVLLILGLGINRLIVREIQVERNLVQGGQAYYAAEGAVEQALYDVKVNLKGYEGEDQEADVGNGAGYFYEIIASGEDWPCRDYGANVYEDEDGVLWRVLGPEESVMVPLFVQDGEDVENLTDFILHYAYDVNDGVPNGDVLRWKILGINEGSGLTEAISEFDTVTGVGYWQAALKDAGYYKNMGCADVWAGCKYEFITEQVNAFLRIHKYNYLVLTNVMGEFIDLQLRLSDGEIDNADSDFVCEYAEIQADGVNGDFIQQIDALIKEGEPLPVFDFVLWEKDPVEWYEATEIGGVSLPF